MTLISASLRVALKIHLNEIRFVFKLKRFFAIIDQMSDIN